MNNILHSYSQFLDVPRSNLLFDLHHHHVPYCRIYHRQVVGIMIIRPGYRMADITMQWNNGTSRGGPGALADIDQFRRICPLDWSAQTNDPVALNSFVRLTTPRRSYRELSYREPHRTAYCVDHTVNIYHARRIAKLIIIYVTKWTAT